MKLAVIGGRTFNNKKLLFEELNKIENIDTIVSGGAIGADTLAEIYARENGIKTLIFKPDYEAFGKGAPLIRNKSIVNNADMIIAFWDGKSRGTKYTIDFAENQNKKVVIIQY